MNTDQIFSELPEDFKKHSVRDVSLLLSAVFTKIHFTQIKKLFNADFTAIFMHCAPGQTGIYRSPQENGNFAETVGERCLRETDFAETIADQSRQLTDKMEQLIKNNNTLEKLINDSSTFFEQFEYFFAYHQAVGFGGEYLADADKNKKNTRAQEIIDILDKVYAYQEMVVPHLEEYFDLLKISDFLPEEIAKNELQEKVSNRSIMYLNGQQIVLNHEEANSLAKKIDKTNQTVIHFDGQIRGLGVGGGKYTGKVQLITDLNKLNTVEPGKVLVVPITRPQYNNYIKKAGAIVSDTGGLLSHPSILAREYKIPCVVGTKIATKVLKEDDLVEIDADQGIVNLITK